MADEITDIIRFISKQLSSFENEYSLPNNLFRKLLDEDDWSFIIKIHAILEGAISKLLADKLDPKLIKIFQKLEFGEKQFGKLKFAEALELLNSDQIKYIQKISELRNNIVHNITNVNFTFKEYLNNLDKNQRKQFLNIITIFSAKEVKSKWIENAENDTKSCIWLFIISLILKISLSSNSARIERYFQQKAYEIMINQKE